VEALAKKNKVKSLKPSTYLTAENMAVRVRSVVMQSAIRPGTLSGGTRNESQDTIMNRVLGK